MKPYDISLKAILHRKCDTKNGIGRAQTNLRSPAQTSFKMSVKINYDGNKNQ